MNNKNKTIFVGASVFVLCAFLALVFAGCEDEFDDYALINKFRVLGVSANPPEVRSDSNAPVEITVLWSDPKGEQRPVSFAWVICGGTILAGDGYTQCDLFDASLAPVVTDAASGGDTYTIPPIPEAAFKRIPEGESVDATAVVLLCAGGTLPAAEQLLNHKRDANIVRLCSGGDGIAAYKTFKLANGDKQGDVANAVPVINELSIDGASSAEQGQYTLNCSATGSCNEGVTLTASFTPESYQPFTEVIFDDSQIKTERPYISWFATGGDWEADISMSDSKQEPAAVDWTPKTPGQYTLWAVANDSRGGVSWQTYQIDVQ